MAKIACASPHLYVDFQILSSSLGKYDECRVCVLKNLYFMSIEQYITFQGR